MERLEGMISDIVFKNEENGYTIAHLANSMDDIVIVGCMPTLSVGESIEVEGKWVNHKTYGTQFEVSKFMPVIPSSLEGIYAYLSSGMIHGIGEKMAKRIVDKFGVNTLDIIQNNPERLEEVEGIGGKKLKQIVKSYEENRELRNIIIELSPYGITPNYCLKIYKKYKDKSIEVINKNPYRLAEDIRGIGFKIADEIANKIGIDKYSDDRICQGILYALNQSLGSGHTYLPKPILIQEAKKILDDAGIVDSDGDGYREFDGDGKNIELSFLTYDSRCLKEFSEGTAANIEKIGIKVNVQETDADTEWNKLTAGEYDLLSTNWLTVQVGDPIGYMENWYSKSKANYCSYKNEKYDKLYEELLVETDQDKIKELVQEMQQILVDDGAALIHGYYKGNICSTKAVEGANVYTADYYWISTAIKPAE